MKATRTWEIILVLLLLVVIGKQSTPRGVLPCPIPFRCGSVAVFERLRGTLQLRTPLSGHGSHQGGHFLARSLHGLVGLLCGLLRGKLLVTLAPESREPAAE